MAIILKEEERNTVLDVTDLMFKFAIKLVAFYGIKDESKDISDLIDETLEEHNERIIKEAFHGNVKVIRER